MRWLLLLLFAVAVLPAANCDGSGNCYVRAGATGSANGSDWINACTTFASGTCAPASMTRSVTYWVAAGSYGDVDFNTAESSTTVITVKAATIANHGTATGWSDGFAGQALFQGNGSFISTGYWTFDGQTRGADWQSSYGIKFQLNNTTANLDRAVLSFVNAVTGITLRYLDLMGTDSGNMASAAGGDNSLYGQGITTLYVGYSFLHHSGNTQVQLNNCATNCGNTHTYEYNYFLHNHTCCSASHDEAYSLTASNVIIRHNVFQNIVSTGIITNATAVNPNMSNWDIYGNLFFWDETFVNNGYRGSGAGNVFLTDGVIAMLGENMSGTFNVYNNTVANIHANASHPCGVGDVRAAMFGHEPGGSVNINVKNNIFWNSCSEGMPMGPNNPPPSFTGTLTWDYQSYFNGAINTADTSANKQSSSTDPFINSTAYTMAGYHLAADTSTWSSLASPFNLDPDGVTRTSSRGAFQFVTAAAGGSRFNAIFGGNVKVQ